MKRCEIHVNCDNTILPCDSRTSRSQLLPSKHCQAIGSGFASSNICSNLVFLPSLHKNLVHMLINGTPLYKVVDAAGETQYEKEHERERQRQRQKERKKEGKKVREEKARWREWPCLLSPLARDIVITKCETVAKDLLVWASSLGWLIWLVRSDAKIVWFSSSKLGIRRIRLIRLIG